MMQIILFCALVFSAVLYAFQYAIFKRKGNPQVAGSLSFTVIYAMLAFLVFKEFKGANFLLYLIPAIGLLVGILQFRDSDFPKFLNVISLAVHILQLSLVVSEQLL